MHFQNKIVQNDSNEKKDELTPENALKPCLNDRPNILRCYFDSLSMGCRPKYRSSLILVLLLHCKRVKKFQPCATFLYTALLNNVRNVRIPQQDDHSSKLYLEISQDKILNCHQALN